VATTFVFNTYLSGNAFGNPAHESELLGVFTAVAGVIIAVVAPVAGQRSDASGRRKLWPGINSGVVVACLVGMVFVQSQPVYLWLGLPVSRSGRSSTSRRRCSKTRCCR